MARRIVTDDDVSVTESRTVESPPLAATIASVVTFVYVAILSLIGLDTLLEALDAREGNGFVRAIDRLSDPFLAPFNGMFSNQSYVLTALVGAVVYTLAYLLLMALLRRDRTL